MKLECKHVWEHISEYIDKRLDPQLLAGVENHLENCEVCSAIMDSYWADGGRRRFPGSGTEPRRS